VRITRAAGDAREHARTADGVDVIVAAGGDGTMSEVVDGLMAKPADEPLPSVAFLALGTANVLAWELDLPRRPGALVRLIESGATLDVRPGIANARRFLLMASAGLDARAVAAVKTLVKRWFGAAAYVLAAAHVISQPPPRLTVEVDGRPMEASLVIVARSRRYGGPFSLTPDAGITKPTFQVVLLHRHGFGPALAYGLALARGRLHERADVSVVAARAVHVLADGDEPLQVDGDAAGALPLVATLDDRTVRLVAGPGAFGDDPRNFDQSA
jgi:diacylglycerol kinase (ATP)